MDHIEFTARERKLLLSWAGYEQRPMSRWSFYAAVLLPALVFAGYGASKNDVVALGIAFSQLFLFICWRIQRESSAVEELSALSAKLLEFEDR